LTVSLPAAIRHEFITRLCCDEGSALTVVMFPLLILAVVAANLVAATRTELLVSQNVTNSTHRHLAIDAVMAQTLVGLVNGGASDVVPDGRILSRNFDGLDIRLSVQSENAKINLNEVSNPALRNLLELSCLTVVEAERLTDAIADYVDDDDIARAQGLEKSGYVALGLRSGPRNGRFQTLGEIRRVPGVTFEIFERIRPHVTVHSFVKTPDLRFATPKTIRSVLGTDRGVTGESDPIASVEPASSSPFVGIISLTSWTVRDGIDEPATVSTVYLTGSDRQPILMLDRQRDVAADPSKARCPDGNDS